MAVEYEIVKELGKLGEPTKSGWQVEVNLVRWGSSKSAKLDIRKWNREKAEVGKGITLDDDQWGELMDILEENR
jgi:hypothetical protein